MSVTLTNEGWAGPLTAGTWSSDADVVLSYQSFVGELIVDLQAEPDEFEFTPAGPALSVAADESIQTGDGNEVLVATTLGGSLAFSGLDQNGNFVSGSDIIGFFSDLLIDAGVLDIDLTAFTVDGLLTTNEGADLISGTVLPSFTSLATPFDFPQFGAGIFVSATGEIGTGKGADSVIGVGLDLAGIFNFGVIDTRDGNDLISGEALPFGFFDNFVSGIYNAEGAVIRMATGKDTLIGNVIGFDESLAFDSLFFGGPVDIFNASEIRMGNGEDTVIAQNGLVGGGGDFFLGMGIDSFYGFGDATVRAGAGDDTLELPDFFGEYAIGTATIDGLEMITFTAEFMGTFVTMNTFAFENLIVGDETFSFATLPTTVGTAIPDPVLVLA